jgi:hypothetical protein
MLLKKYWSKALYFFRTLYNFYPIQLLLAYLKSYQLYLLIWLLPFLIALNSFGLNFGIPSLFLNPEHEGNSGIFAFLFMGLATGAFIMAFHVSSYVTMIHRYPFVAAVSKPFYVFAINNSIIPVIYICVYLFQSIQNQSVQELIPFGQIVLTSISFIIGTLLFIYLSFGLFYIFVIGLPSIYTFSAQKIEETWFKGALKKYTNERDTKIQNIYSGAYGPVNVEFYLRSFFKIGKARQYKHYNKTIFTNILYRQHFNVLYYVIGILAFIIVRGQMKDDVFLILPAGASLLLIFTVIMLLFTLIYIFFKRWTLSFLIIFLVAINYFYSLKTSWNNNAYGLDYKLENKNINILGHGDYKKDSLETIHILEKWKYKNTNKKGHSYKPRMVIVCTSGGGLKMALWTYYSLGYVDSLTNGSLMRHTQLITGASGGMLGAAYLRELYLEHLEGKISSHFSSTYVNRLSKDLLNPVLYSFSMSDWFFRFERFSYAGYKYYKDRAYMFEKFVNKNLGPLLDKPLSAYYEPEKKALVPMMIFNPTIMNTGSRLVISPINVSYLVKSGYSDSLRNIEFRYHYGSFGADSLRFISAIRISASFPYVSPQVVLPGIPTLRVFDAGINDDFGYLTAYNFIVYFQEWIKNNTDGVIVISLDENSNYNENYKNTPSIVSDILKPVKSVVFNSSYIQKTNYLQLLYSLNKLIPGKFYFIKLNLGSPEKKVSLSWHLTKHEKQIILKSIHSGTNGPEINRLMNLLE